MSESKKEYGNYVMPLDKDRLNMLTDNYPKEALELGLLLGEIDIRTGLKKESFVSNDVIDFFKWQVLETVNLVTSFGMTPALRSYFTKIIIPLLEYKPVDKLSGADWEWISVGNEESRDKVDIYQNIRCSDVFKQGKTGKAYWSKGRLFSTDEGKTWKTMGARSHVELIFPCKLPAQEREIICEEEKRYVD